MHFETGKHAAFIWSAYGLTVLVFAALIVSSLSRTRHWRKRFEELSRK